MYFTLSWRNIWRNKKRTLIVVASVFFAVLLATVMRSTQRGTYGYMIHSAAKLFTGYVQVQGNGYWDDRSLDKSIVLKQNWQRDIASIPRNNHDASPGSLCAGFFRYDNQVAQVIGIEPVLEDQDDRLTETIWSGAISHAQFRWRSDWCWVGATLKIRLGENLVLYGQGYQRNGGLLRFR